MTGEQTEINGTDVRNEVYQTLSVQEKSIARLQVEETIEEIVQVAKVIHDEDGRVIFCGIGKSGDVAKKITSTFNSIGISSLFIHPIEALHGDLGALLDDDIVILISNSGNTDELVELQQFLREFHVTTIAITSNPGSKLGLQTDYHINTKVNKEGAVVELVPMASATTTMVIGDCIANALMTNEDFSERDYGHFHPGGTIGKKLLLTVGDIMDEDLPKTLPSDSLAQAAVKISEGANGIAIIQDTNNHVLGTLTDGDLRRLIESDIDFHDTKVNEVMITDPITIKPEVTAIEALKKLEENNISQLIVVDDTKQFKGVLHIHDIMNEGLTND